MARFFLLLFPLLLLFSAHLNSAITASALKVVDVENPVINITPSFNGKSPNRGETKDFLYCERVKVSGHSRLEWRSYANSFRVSLAPSAAIPERFQSRIKVCSHGNVSLPLCGCGEEEWNVLRKGLWSSVTSPYGEKFVDVKFTGEISGPVKIVIEEDLQQWRFFCLAVGFLLLLVAPIVSSWAPFYYTSAMAIGVFLVVIILLFHGMKLLPTGRKNFFYLSIYGSMLGAGTFILHHFSMLINSILINFGLNEEIYNPVYVFVALGIVLSGAALGYWIVRKYVILDGDVDIGVAHFVKWAMRIIAATFVFQSTLDATLALVTFLFLYVISSLINRCLRYKPEPHHPSHDVSPFVQMGRQVTPKHNRAEFLRRPGSLSSGRNSTKSDSINGFQSPSARLRKQQDYFSTFHKTPNQMKFTEEEWHDFTKEWTEKAVAEWAASPEVASWLVQNADRIQLRPNDDSSEDSVGSGSDSTDETNGGSNLNFNIW